MVITQRHAEVFAAAALYASLILFDWNLYSHLGLAHIFVLSGLRFLLLVCPLVLGIFLARSQFLARWQKILMTGLWLFFLPYTVYSIAEIRHVSELCRLEAGQYYAPACLPGAWTLLPVFTYALAGTLIFVFSVSQVMNRVFTRSWLKRLAILGTCAYAALAGTFGLYSRLNAWDTVFHPGETLAAIKRLPLPQFFSDAAAIAIFYVIILFVTNRLLRWGNRYIQGRDL